MLKIYCYLIISSALHNLLLADAASQAPTPNDTFNAYQIDPTTPYNPNNAQQQPGQNISDDKPDVIKNQTNVATIPIIGIATGAVGYYWDANMTDITLTHSGRAKIQDDEFINCIAVDATNTSYDPGYLDLIATFERLDPISNNPIFYNVYGAYLDTIIPTPDTYEVI